jgi:anti-repressor protein
MSQLTPFNFKGHAVRSLVIADAPWFVARDVCECLEINNHRQALTRLDDDEKGVITTDTLGGSQELLTVNESGVYSLIFASRKPEAKALRP